jgi:Glyoxalase/Bleomycin resistance protein/Dioxygenase superfamily
MSEKAKLKQVAPSFVVADVMKTAEYYRDELGFTILGYFLDPPVFAMVARDGVEIHIGRIDEGKTVRVNEEARKGLGTDAYIFVDDVQALYEEFKEKNVEIVEGPVRRVYNRIELTIKDINGFQLVFGQ